MKPEMRVSNANGYVVSVCSVQQAGIHNGACLQCEESISGKGRFGRISWQEGCRFRILVSSSLQFLLPSRELMMVELLECVNSTELYSS